MMKQKISSKIMKL